MTDATQRELLNVITLVAFLVGGMYLLYLMLTWTVTLAGRAIDRDPSRDRSRRHPSGPRPTGHPTGHHRYANPGPTAYWIGHAAWAAVPTEPVGPAESDAPWADWLGRDRDRMERAATEARGIMVGGGPAGDRPCGQGRPGSIARALPVVTVAHGPHAGARVRLLMESAEYPAEWFVEVLKGPSRGSVWLVGRGQLSGFSGYK